MLKYIKDDNKYRHHDVTVNLGPGHLYSADGNVSFRVWTNVHKLIRNNAYSTVVLTPSYRVTEQETVKGVAKAAAKDMGRLIDLGVCRKGEVLVLNADGTHKDKSSKSTTGPWFLDAQNDPEIAAIVEKYKIDFATVVTEDSGIFSSSPGQTDVRGKGSQFECSFNFIRHYAMAEECYIMCVDSDLKGTDGFVYRMCLGLHEGYSYLLPHYWRYKYEGRATNHLMYPLYAAVTRTAVRQPIGGEFAFNAKMLARFTDVHRWCKGWRDFGIDMGMTITAGTSGDDIGQVVLPRKINYVGQDARNQVGDIFVQEGRSLFNGLVNYMESNDDWNSRSLATAPVFETETFDNNNLVTELDDQREIISALSKFIFLFKNTPFQYQGKDVLGVLYDKVLKCFEKYENHGLLWLGKEITSPKFLDDEKSEVINKIFSLEDSELLTTNEWAEIVFKCLEEFQVRRRKDEENACKDVIRCVLLCVFYLRVFSFNVKTFHLPSYPCAESLLEDQMKEFLRVAQEQF